MMQMDQRESSHTSKPTEEEDVGLDQNGYKAWITTTEKQLNSEYWRLR